MGRLGGIRIIRLQQVALCLLCLYRLPDRFSESPLPGRIHGSQLEQQSLGHQQGDHFHGRMQTHGTERTCSGC